MRQDIQIKVVVRKLRNRDIRKNGMSFRIRIKLIILVNGQIKNINCFLRHSESMVKTGKRLMNSSKLETYSIFALMLKNSLKSFLDFINLIMWFVQLKMANFIWRSFKNMLKDPNSGNIDY